LYFLNEKKWNSFSPGRRSAQNPDFLKLTIIVDSMLFGTVRLDHVQFLGRCWNIFRQRLLSSSPQKKNWTVYVYELG